MDSDWIIQEIRRQDAEDAYRNQIGLPTLDAPEPDWLEVYSILSASFQKAPVPSGVKTNLKRKVGKMTFEEKPPKPRKKVAMKRGPNDPPIPQRSGAVYVNGRPRPMWEDAE